MLSMVGINSKDICFKGKVIKCVVWILSWGKRKSIVSKKNKFINGFGIGRVFILMIISLR